MSRRRTEPVTPEKMMLPAAQRRAEERASACSPTFGGSTARLSLADHKPPPSLIGEVAFRTRNAQTCSTACSRASA